MCNQIRSSIGRAYRNSHALAVALTASLILASAGIAQATPVTLPDVGVDFEGLVTATGTALGAIVVVIVGLYFAFLLVKKAMSWSRKAF